MEMISSTRSLSLLEQKRIQWAKEREEMIGLCGLWGHPKHNNSSLSKDENYKSEEYQLRKNSVLPPIQTKSEADETQPRLQNCNRPEEESETSGYLSDSPKRLNEKESVSDICYKEEDNVNSNWYEREEKDKNYSADSTAEGSRTMYPMDRKSFKNYRNERWTQHSSDSWHHQSVKNSKNWWFGTPESVSSDDGNRLKWGDRGVGIGHLWEPVIHQPESRLPQLESYRPTPKWVERGLRQADGTQKADILIIHHPDDDQYKSYSSDNQSPKSFLLGQNVRLTPDVIEERERKRRKAMEHQNAIRQQLEDRERKRKEERQNKLREEQLEEERIKREQETERLRLEEEHKRNKEKEEKEKRKEEVMKEAIEIAEKKAKEEKKYHRKHLNFLRQEEAVQEKQEATEHSESSREKKSSVRTPKSKNLEESIKTLRLEKGSSDRHATSLGKIKSRKDSSCQFEKIRIPNGIQFLNMNNLSMDGNLALLLENTVPENNLLVPTDGVQLALLMSPGSVNTSQIIPIQTPIPSAITPRGRVLTPSKFRHMEYSQVSQRDGATQTDGICCPTLLKTSRSLPRNRKQLRRSERISGGSDSSEKSNSPERPQAHYQCVSSSKYRSRSQPKYSIDDRPKWGINRPSVQYKKQSEKDIYYQKRMKQRLKKVNDVSISTEISPKTKDDSPNQVEEKLLNSEIRLLKCDTDDDETECQKTSQSPTEDIMLRNGYRMNSNPSSPFFVPIDTDRSATGKSEDGEEFLLELTIEPKILGKEEGDEMLKMKDEKKYENTALSGSIGYVTQTQLEAIRQLMSLREGLKKLQMDFSSSRSITPHSEKNE